MPFLDIAAIGLIIPIVGWGIGRVESLRGELQDLKVKVSRNEGKIEILEADFSSKLDIVIFRLRVLEEEVKQRD
ncbi:hypothetical protein [Brunnivagina elsteri]|uniref:Uncharacterized protein n=1 Tax=Brunnivagina elsteri CCALA 953 TaxID=987040 RepID=A0A2A2TNI0_9CYAN|nr:hypothetical protein [Calothrix elsteri]PAX60039.1 hypothetical protein CK510_03995 [Calothrix elsteri CCALA 953]